ncbi:MAG: DUF47 family protein [Clostridiales bacterium]|jgi:predicted phosphate transport protein (TIGR00153 family)|nr:DUF47 family protein [Clostridiales bacterium]
MRNKQNNYFEAFFNHADLSCKAAKEVADTLENFDPFSLPDAVERVHLIENQADIVKREIVAALSREFLPPIEREDIMQLADELDNVTDSVEDVLRGIYTYNITSIKPEAIDFVKLVCNICVALRETVEDFKGFRKSSTLQGRIIRVNDLEVEGDKLFTNAMRTLFVNASDPRELIVWQNIFTSLEVCCDNCEHVADAIEAAVLKNS